MTFFKMLKNFVYEEPGLFIQYTVFSLLLSLTGLYLPWLVKNFIEGISSSHYLYFEDFIFSRIILCCIFIYVLYRQVVICVGKFVQLNIFKLRDRILSRIIITPFHEAKKHDFSSLSHNIIQDINGIETNLIPFLNLLFFHLFIVIGILGLMLEISWLLFAVISGFFILSVITVFYLGRNLEQTGIKAQQALMKTFSKLQDILNGLQLIKAYGLEQKQIKKINLLNQDYRDQTFEFIKKEALIIPFNYLLEIIGIGLVLLVGANLVHSKQISIGYLFTFILYIEILGEPASRLSMYILSIKNINAFLSRLSFIIEKTNKLAASYFTAQNKVDEVSQIEVKQLSFKYHQINKQIFENINFSAKKGDIFGICGKNGAGKSTLVELLLGFLQPNNGEILVNGINLFSLNEANWRQKICLMPQKPYFFEDTIKNNLTLFNEGITDYNLQETINLVEANEIIAKLPDGLNTIIANHLTSLSGGEFQKLSLIRVLLMSPEVIILDEPFNHLDTHSCENLKEVILKIAKNKIVFIIEHHDQIVDKIATKTILLGATTD